MDALHRRFQVMWPGKLRPSGNGFVTECEVALNMLWFPRGTRIVFSEHAHEKDATVIAQAHGFKVVYGGKTAILD